MAQRVQPVAAPGPGEDWRYTVPGNYLIDVTSVVARLTTAVGPSVSTAIDASGNGNDGQYTQAGGITFGLPGLVEGDTCVSIAVNPPVTNTQLIMPAAGLAFGTPFSVAYWVDPNARCEFEGDGFADQGFAFDFPALTWSWKIGGVFNIGGFLDPGLGTPARLIGFRWTGTDVYMYVNGFEIRHDGPFVAGPMPPGGMWDLQSTLGLIGAGPGVATLDEFACWSSDIGAAAFAALYAAGISGIAAYTAAVLALTPDTYYHLDDANLPTIGRTPALEITDGTHVVGRYAPSFPPAPVADSFAYSWIVGLADNNQPASGDVTTVSIPRLILPAGYTIGSSTPDLGELDQWSDIAIWWDDALQQQTLNLKPYRYPPGVHLVYQPKGSG